MLPADHGNLDLLCAALLVGDAIEQERDHERADHGSDDDRVNRPLVAERVHQFFADYNNDAPDLHSAGASCPAKATNASSSDNLPLRAISSSGDPSAATRPLAMTMMRSQRAETSCIT